MSNTETWGIVLRDRASGAEQWVACEVTRDGDIVTARALGHEHRVVEYAQSAVAGVARKIEHDDRTLIHARCETPDEYAAHMECVRRILAADETERLRTAVAERDATLADLRHASNRAAVAYAESLARCEAEAFRRGAEAMREVAAKECDRREKELSDGERRAFDRDSRDDWRILASEQRMAAEAIRRLPLPATPQPEQVDEATATSDAPLTIADAAARARRAAAQRAR